MIIMIVMMSDDNDDNYNNCTNDTNYKNDRPLCGISRSVNTYTLSSGHIRGSIQYTVDCKRNSFNNILDLFNPNCSRLCAVQQYKCMHHYSRITKNELDKEPPISNR